MAEWRDFGASNEPDTCIWCGKVLRHKSHDEVYEHVDVPLKADDYLRTEVGLTTRKVQRLVSNTHAEKGGDYEDGFFCGLRCGYMFAVAMANNGRRFSPKKETR